VRVCFRERMYFCVYVILGEREKKRVFLCVCVYERADIDNISSLPLLTLLLHNPTLTPNMKVDAKYALSSTSARVVVAGANVILAAWRSALAIDAQVLLCHVMLLLFCVVMLYNVMLCHVI
jgi:hypothetical protein